MKKNELFAQILTLVTKYLRVLVVLVILGICLSGVRIVKSGNVALILRFGQLVGDTYEEQVHEPGLLLAMPYIIDEVVIVPTGSVIEQSITTYFTPDTGKSSDGTYVVTGDENIATLSASVKYLISDPVAYALNVSDISAMINGAVSNAMLCQAAQTDVDDLLTSGKDAFTSASVKQAAQALELANAGVTLTNLELTQVSMPSEVRTIYNQVNSSTVYAQTIIENANNYRTTVIPYAQSSASTQIALANANKATAVGDANTALVEFWGLVEEYRQNPEVVRTRLYSQKVSQLLQAIQRVHVVQDGQERIYIQMTPTETPTMP
jgi:membrane protease subunit HflK